MPGRSYATCPFPPILHCLHGVYKANTPAAIPAAAKPHEASVACAARPELEAVALAWVPLALPLAVVVAFPLSSSPSSTSVPPEVVWFALAAAPWRGRLSTPVLFMQFLE